MSLTLFTGLKSCFPLNIVICRASLDFSTGQCSRCILCDANTTTNSFIYFTHFLLNDSNLVASSIFVIFRFCFFLNRETIKKQTHAFHTMRNPESLIAVAFLKRRFLNIPHFPHYCIFH